MQLVGLEVAMVEKDTVSKDFRKQVLGYGLTTAEIVYRRPDRYWLLQTYVWQDYDMFPNFPALRDFLVFWEKSLEGPLFAVTVAHSKLIKPAELHAVDGVQLGRLDQFGVRDGDRKQRAFELCFPEREAML